MVLAELGDLPVPDLVQVALVLLERHATRSPPSHQPNWDDDVVPGVENVLRLDAQAGVKAARRVGLQFGGDERSRRSHRRSAEPHRSATEGSASERGARRQLPFHQRLGATVAGELIVLLARELVVLVLVVLFVLWVAYRLVRESRH